MMNKPRIYQMSFSKIDPLYVKKKKRRKKDKPKKKSMKSSVSWQDNAKKN